MSEIQNPLPREVADAYVDELIALDPVTGTYLGVRASSSALPDYSPQVRRGSPSWPAVRSPVWRPPRPGRAPTRTSSGAAPGCCVSG